MNITLCHPPLLGSKGVDGTIRRFVLPFVFDSWRRKLRGDKTEARVEREKKGKDKYKERGIEKRKEK
jgi:hypothetical protein